MSEWVIPIVNDRTGEVTGVFTLGEDNRVTIVGAPELGVRRVGRREPAEHPAPESLVFGCYEPSASERGVASSEVAGSGARHGDSTARGKPVRRPTTSRSEAPRRPTPKQIAEVATLFSKSILEEPLYQEALKRGRAVYDKAVALAGTEGIPLTEALERVAQSGRAPA